MYFKLILKNSKKSVKDYSIYFLTLMIAVSLFYSFNSINSQQAMTSLSTTKGFLTEQMGIFIGIISYLIAIILAALVVYSNLFLLKRRKKEIGIYMTLGMEKGKISRIFVGETFIIGVVAMATGLLLGFILSQGLSMIALKLLAIDFSLFKVTFSSSAFVKTIICFAIIFLVVMVFNVLVISKVKLIDLLTASRKNETIKVQNKWVSIIIFVSSILLLARAGILISGDDMRSDNFKAIAFFICIGTLLFFYSLSSALLTIIKNNKKLYLKGLNTFLCRQIGSKIHTNFISMSVICLLLTSSISILGTGISVALTMNSHAEASAPYDMTIVSDIKKEGDIDIFQVVTKRGIPIKDYVKDYVQITTYNSDWTYKQTFIEKDVTLWEHDKGLENIAMPVISVSDYNKAMQLQGKNTVKLSGSEFLLNCNYKGTKDIMEDFIKLNGSVTINGNTLKTQSKQLLNETITMTSVDNNDRGSLIVSDSVVKGLEKDSKIFSGIYKESTTPDDVVNSCVKAFSNPEEGFLYTTKTMMYDMYFGTQAIASFLCSYIGLILLIICVAILALQQLTETADNVHRYGLIKKLGADPSSINSTLFKQIAIYFFVPLIVSSLYSIVIITKITMVLGEFLNINISINMMFTVVVFLVVYGGYFITTYLACKKMINENQL